MYPDPGVVLLNRNEWCEITGIKSHRSKQCVNLECPKIPRFMFRGGGKSEQKPAFLERDCGIGSSADLPKSWQFLILRINLADRVSFAYQTESCQ